MIERLLGLLSLARESGGEPVGQQRTIAVDVEAGEETVHGRRGVKSRREEVGVSVRESMKGKKSQPYS